MKLKDYDQGKPLTVRRIMAVKAAIDECAVRANDAFARAKASAVNPWVECRGSGQGEAHWRGRDIDVRNVA